MEDLSYFHPDKVAVRRELRRLYDRWPAAFESVMGELIGDGRRFWQLRLPPLERKRGRPVLVQDSTLVMLLADYRNRPDGVSRSEFCDRRAKRGLNFGSAYSCGVWRSSKTIESYLDKAEKRARIDVDFAADVEDAQEMLRLEKTV